MSFFREFQHNFLWTKSGQMLSSGTSPTKVHFFFGSFFRPIAESLGYSVIYQFEGLDEYNLNMDFKENRRFGERAIELQRQTRHENGGPPHVFEVRLRGQKYHLECC
jgi:hypothetical protein